MTAIITLVAVIGVYLFIVSPLVIAINGLVDGEFSDRSQGSGMESYENKYVGPYARVYDVAYTYGKWRQSPAQVARRDARAARNKARIEERRKNYNQKEGQ